MNARVPRSRVTHDRWLVSYADFITLLFGLFVVMFAFARADQRRQAQVSKAIDSAFRSMGALPDAANAESGANDAATPAKTVMDESVVAPAKVKEDLDRIRRDLAATLSTQIAAHAVSLEMGRDGLVISLREAGFFESGSATPKAEALPTLRQIAGRLGPTPYDLEDRGPHR